MTAPVTSPLIEARGLEVRYGAAMALRVDEIAILPGEILALIGPNGSGKSTLLRVLALLQRPAAGEVRYHGEPVRPDSRELLRLRRRTATVFQAPLLLDTTVYENVALGLRFRGVPEREVRRRVGEWLGRLGIAHLADRRSRTLSGGEAQRASLARAFVLEPEVLFLDEPFSALDPPTRETLLLELEAILRESRVTAVFVTHDRLEALTLADRVAVMLSGRLRQVDTVERVFGAPADPEVARFVGVENLIPATVTGRDGVDLVLAVPGGALRVKGRGLGPDGPTPGDEVLVAFRAEDVTLARPTVPELHADQNAVLGRVARIVRVGSGLRVHLDVGFELQALVSRPAARQLRLTVGTELRALLAPDVPHLILRRRGVQGPAPRVAAGGETR
ncbi:MAG TPA: ABC transporter ATP-binding protein [Gemmatimonadales bacterium]|nr:ABC transporter ATP-binding protein [Gemmatimonadales bacterium]